MEEARMVEGTLGGGTQEKNTVSSGGREQCLPTITEQGQRNFLDSLFYCFVEIIQIAHQTSGQDGSIGKHACLLT